MSNMLLIIVAWLYSAILTVLGITTFIKELKGVNE